MPWVQNTTEGNSMSETGCPVEETVVMTGWSNQSTYDWWEVTQQQMVKIRMSSIQTPLANRDWKSKSCFIFKANVRFQFLIDH